MEIIVMEQFVNSCIELNKAMMGFNNSYDDLMKSHDFTIYQLSAIIDIIKCNTEIDPKDLVELKLNKFYEDQLNVIVDGFRDELSIEKIKLYANPRFNVAQMNCIRKCIKEGFTYDKIKIMINPAFSNTEMTLISFILEMIYDDEDIKIISEYISPRKSLLSELEYIHIMIEEFVLPSNIRHVIDFMKSLNDDEIEALPIDFDRCIDFVNNKITNK